MSLTISPVGLSSKAISFRGKENNSNKIQQEKINEKIQELTPSQRRQLTQTVKALALGLGLAVGSTFNSCSSSPDDPIPVPPKPPVPVEPKPDPTPTPVDTVAIMKSNMASSVKLLTGVQVPNNELSSIMYKLPDSTVVKITKNQELSSDKKYVFDKVIGNKSYEKLTITSDPSNMTGLKLNVQTPINPAFVPGNGQQSGSFIDKSNQNISVSGNEVKFTDASTNALVKSMKKLDDGIISIIEANGSASTLSRVKINDTADYPVVKIDSTKAQIAQASMKSMLETLGLVSVTKASSPEKGDIVQIKYFDPSYSANRDISIFKEESSNDKLIYWAEDILTYDDSKTPGVSKYEISSMENGKLNIKNLIPVDVTTANKQGKNYKGEWEVVTDWIYSKENGSIVAYKNDSGKIGLKRKVYSPSSSGGVDVLNCLNNKVTNCKDFSVKFAE